MEPILPMPSQPENTPSSEGVNSGNSEYYSKPEGTGGAGNTEKLGELHPVVGTIPSTSPVQQQQQPVQQQQQSAGLAKQDDTSAPIIADDVDVIEKEWVDKAKKIVSSTKEDPHMQEKQVSKLQADYLKKRYNKQIKLAE